MTDIEITLEQVEAAIEGLHKFAEACWSVHQQPLRVLGRYRMTDSTGACFW